MTHLNTYFLMQFSWIGFIGTIITRYKIWSAALINVPSCDNIGILIHDLFVEFATSIWWKFKIMQQTF